MSAYEPLKFSQNCNTTVEKRVPARIYKDCEREAKIRLTQTPKLEDPWFGIEVPFNANGKDDLVAGQDA